MKRIAVVLLAVLLACAAGLYFGASRLLASDVVRTRLERELTARLGQPVHISSLSARIVPGVAVDLRDVSIGEPAALRLERIRVVTGLRALFADTIDVRQIEVRNGRPGGSGPPVSFDLDAAVLGDRLDVRSATVRGPVNKIEARGALTSIAGVEGAFTATTELLDLTELLAIGAALAPPPRPGAQPTPLHLTVQLSATRVRFGPDELRELSTTIEATPAQVVLDALSTKLFGGAFKGRLAADTSHAAPVLRLSGTMTALDVADLLKRTGSAGGVTGKLSGSVSLVAQGLDAAALTQSARGTINATIANGSLPHLDVVRTVVLAFGKPSGGTPAGAGTAFDSLRGTLTLANGTLRSDNLALRSRDLDTDGRGTLSIDSGALDARADVSLSPELTAQAGTDLRRYAQQDGRIVVPATVDGTIDQPKLFIDVAAAAKRALGNEAQRRVTDFLGGLFTRKKKGGG